MKKKPTIQVWPISIRIFHWGLVILMISIFVSSFEDRWLPTHINLGLVILGITLWRIYYGYFGAFHALFKNFLVSPKKLAIYLSLLKQGKPPRHIGHPPPAGWMVLLFLGTMLIATLSGILVQMGEERHVMWEITISNDFGAIAKNVHSGASWFSLALIFAHIGGVLLDSWLHRTNLPKTMITGRKEISSSKSPDKIQEDPSLKDSIRTSVVVGLIIFSLSVIAIQIQPIDPGAREPVPFDEAQNTKLWSSECGSCHQLFHPSLLPARSWEKMMLQLESHFGDDAYLEEEDQLKVTKFLVSNSAETSDFEAAYKIRNSLAEGATPIAISVTPYWIRKHDDIAPEIYRRSDIKSAANCLACHQDAESGRFEDHFSIIPNQKKEN
ncbi:MAG: hypothetical protein GY786_22690 [Proteobacteria bacterium]|nr:hypothetical protein [Pseudomonadota bacterium]